MKELWLFARQYPSGRGEAFLEHALPVWAQQFERVRVIPMFAGEDVMRLPDGIEEVRLWKDSPHDTLSLVATLGNLGPVLRMFRHHGPKGERSYRDILSLSRQLVRKARIVEDRLLPSYDPQKVAALCVWMEDWVNVLGMVKERYPRFHFSAMAHGWDLYEHRRTIGSIPFRKFQMQAVEKVFGVSQRGFQHLRSTFPEHADKVRHCHLGTPDHGAASWSLSNTLRIASCSYLRNPKRVDLIVKALARIGRTVHWTHFGDGPERPVIDELVAALPSNITVDLRGNVSNSGVLAWYGQNTVDIFLHFSESEGGVPLALQEAASFGIPLLGNDVGGIGEIVGPDTGRLLAADPSAQDIVDALQSAGMERWLSPEFRSNVRSFWRDRFLASTNFIRLADEI